MSAHILRVQLNQGVAKVATGSMVAGLYSRDVLSHIMVRQEAETRK